MAKAKNIKITDDRYGGVFNTGLNGRIEKIPHNTEIEAGKDLRDHLDELGVAFEVVSGAGSEEGSGEPAPTPPEEKPEHPKPPAKPKKAKKAKPTTAKK